MNDNYITLINRFWNCSIERAFNTSDCMVYFYLLNTCNALHWKQPFGQSDRYMSMQLGISVPTIREAKCRLKQRGLIDFKAPHKASKSFDGQTKYTFPGNPETVQKILTDDYTVTFTDTFTDTSTDAFTNSKPNKTKQNKEKKRTVKEKRQFVYSHSSPAFTDVWNKLLTCRKWKKKSTLALQMILDELGYFDEDYAISLIQQAIVGNWTGIIYPETKLKYDQWKKSGNNEQATPKNIERDNESGRRKSEIIRRAVKAASMCSDECA